MLEKRIAAESYEFDSSYQLALAQTRERACVARGHSFAELAMSRNAFLLTSYFKSRSRCVGVNFRWRRV